MLGNTMRSAVITEPRAANIREVELPRPAPEEVLVRLEGCGVCGSNLPVWEGRPWFQYPVNPGSPGHEGWGVVAATGKDVRHVREGDRVAFLSERAFAEYDITHQDALVPLPAALDELAVPGEALGCVMNIWKRSQVQAGQTVAIVGLGFLGAALTSLASKAGARVIAVSKRPYSLEVARRMGASEVLTIGDNEQEVVDRVWQLTEGKGCECVIEAVGLAQPLNLAAKLCGVRARLVIAGFHQDGKREVDLQLWNWHGLDVINAHERDPAVYVQGMRAAVEALAAGDLPIEELITHRIPLAEAGRALELLRTRPDGFVKAVVLP